MYKRQGLKQADIDIVGGSDVFFDRLVQAVGMGKSIDGFLDKSEASQKLLKGYLDGDASFVGDLKEVLSRPAASSDDVRNLTLAAFLGRLMHGEEGDRQTKIAQLLEVAERMGLDNVKLNKLLQ